MLKNIFTKSNKKTIERPLQTNLSSFAVHIVEHCNLNCQFCDHFSPLAEEEFADIKVFEKDFARLSELLNAKIDSIGLMGGEPLLHPQLNDFLYVARKYFPETKRLRLVTNGILLLKQTEDFWKACRDNDIIIVNTKYPISLDFDKIREVAKKHNVKFEYYDNSGEVLKTSYHIPLDLEGRQNAHKNFIKCQHAVTCSFLSKGKFFTCTVAPNIRHFNKFFNKNIPLTNDDCIDIYKAENLDEIMHFLCRPIPFCKYCYVKKRTYGNEWQRSKKDIKEWTV